jgi:hypothetical protein
MRRKIKHLKRYKSYPNNVPRKLLKLFFDLDCSVSKLAKDRNINTGIVSALLNDGKEPVSISPRIALFLKPNPICKKCGRKIIHIRTGKQREPKPDFIIQWDHLDKEERHKVIQEYLKWRSTNSKH